LTSQMAVELDRDELRSLLADTIDVDASEIGDDTDFIAELSVDSLMALEIVVVLERKYEVKFTELEMRAVRTLSSACEAVRNKLAERV
jgi:acyl carrier protein